MILWKTFYAAQIHDCLSGSAQHKTDFKKVRTYEKIWKYLFYLESGCFCVYVCYGGVCHTGSFTCFGAEPDEKSSMERLYGTISERFANPRPGSYTATLNDKRVREKVEEEAEEICEAEGKDEVIWEAADLLYFVSVLMYKEGVTWQDVYNELDRRHKK